MNKLMIYIASSTILLLGSERSVPITNQSVDSEKAQQKVWEHKGFALLFKKQVAQFEVLNSPARRTRKRFFVEPLPHVRLLPILAIDRY